MPEEERVRVVGIDDQFAELGYTLFLDTGGTLWTARWSKSGQSVEMGSPIAEGASAVDAARNALDVLKRTLAERPSS